MPVLNATTTRGGDSNAGTVANTFEAKNTQGAAVKYATAGKNAGSAANTFEPRAAQEAGSH